MVIPLKNCIARPADATGSHPLVEHLEAAAFGWGNPTADHESRLRFLAGLMHDAGKAHALWQRYINQPEGERRKGPPHSPAGAALFCYCALKLIDKWQIKKRQKRALHFYIMKLCRDIYDHHGPLQNIEAAVPWADSLEGGFFDDVDLNGLFKLTANHFPEIKGHPEEFKQWLDSFPETWEKWYYKLPGGIKRRLHECDNKYDAAALLALRCDTARLISADRYHAAGLKPAYLTGQDAEKALQTFNAGCTKTAETVLNQRIASPQVVKLRQWLQETAYNKYQKYKQQNFFSLNLPTGMGKTLTALRIALAAAIEGRCQKIIYAAPYLSILSQAAAEIKKYTGLEVVQHHHLAAVNIDKPKDCSEDFYYLALEAWQAAPILATTFNQLFLALFPKRAQQTMRLEGLKNAFLIIDEPQIIDAAVWNLFLKLLSAAARQYNLQVLFTTATLPPTELGLAESVTALAPQFEHPDRYRINFMPQPLDQYSTAAVVLEKIRKVKSVGVIMNTIEDAVLVYKEVKRQAGPEIKCFNLSGRMTALHKAQRIKEIADCLKTDKPTVVVCTQILEAGVDLSFNLILRALPILPSIAQAAGRANRHGAGERADAAVFRFLRDGEKETRQFVYRSAIACEETDKILAQHPSWQERQTLKIIEQYYRNCFSRNTQTTLLDSITDAACGEWSALAGVNPFAGSVPGIDLFVPWGEQYLPPQVKKILRQYAPQGIEQLYEMYADKEYLKLNYVDKKRFIGLLQYFTVPAAEKTALKLAAAVDDAAVLRLADPTLYSDETGLAGVTGEEDEPLFI